jgi:hypothetical protein
MGTRIAEDLLVLLLDERSGRVAEGTNADTVLGGALLIELALLGAVTVSERTGLWRTAKVRVEPGVDVDDPMLGEALAVVAQKERGAQDLVTRLGRGCRDKVAARLVERGTLRLEESRALGLFRSRRWPAADPARASQLRQSLRGPLLQGTTPDERTAALVALLHAVNRAHRTIDLEGRPAREVKRRAKEISEGAWAATAVRDSIQAATAAMTAAVTAAVIAGGASS